MQAGILNQTITIQKKPEPETLSNMGAAIEAWTDFITDLPAAFQVVGTREFPMFEKRHAETTARFVIRYREGLVGETSKHRVVHNSRRWNILGMEDPDGGTVAIHIEVSVVR